MNLWQRIPLVIRAVVLGFAVSTLGIGIWVVLFSTVPVPWSLGLMAIVLWAYWKYFGGTGWPTSTAAYRRESLRATTMTPAAWRQSLGAAACFVVAFHAGLVVTFRIMPIPLDALTAEYNFDATSLWLAWPTIVMASLVAGVCEEVGYRGYMQVPLERRYGPVPAIAIVVVAFLAAHLHQAWLPPFLIVGIYGSIMLGVLAWASRSLVPGVIAHAVMDVGNFSYWWSDIAGRFERQPISETGVDAHFLISVAVLATSIALFTLLVRRLLASRPEEASS